MEEQKAVATTNCCRNPMVNKKGLYVIDFSSPGEGMAGKLVKL